jgi:hypothetical protein
LFARHAGLELQWDRKKEKEEFIEIKKRYKK